MLFSGDNNSPIALKSFGRIFVTVHITTVSCVLIGSYRRYAAGPNDWMCSWYTLHYPDPQVTWLWGRLSQIHNHLFSTVHNTVFVPWWGMGEHLPVHTRIPVGLEDLGSYLHSLFITRCTQFISLFQYLWLVHMHCKIFYCVRWQNYGSSHLLYVALKKCNRFFRTVWQLRVIYVVL